ncbi:hypothetical protein KY325_01650 [Candidatus Woesearchaeota archaeon]|nr:hypothetical protein [Candidatus Woesearchaeota archaeon]MBW3017842.1 hypothetical protein [Candidatus Woesearchaeota archaeon]
MVHKIMIELAVIAIILAMFILIFSFMGSDLTNATTAILVDVNEYKPETVTFSVNDKVLTMTELENRKVFIDNRYYDVTLINVVDRKAQIIIDGRITEKLGVTEEDIVAGLRVKIGEIRS